MPDLHEEIFHGGFRGDARVAAADLLLNVTHDRSHPSRDASRSESVTQSVDHVDDLAQLRDGAGHNAAGRGRAYRGVSSLGVLALLAGILACA